MRYKIDVLMPNFSQYNALHYFTRKFYEAFQRAGHECRLLDGEERYFSLWKARRISPYALTGLSKHLQDFC